MLLLTALCCSVPKIYAECLIQREFFHIPSSVTRPLDPGVEGVFARRDLSDAGLLKPAGRLSFLDRL